MSGYVEWRNIYEYSASKHGVLTLVPENFIISENLMCSTFICSMSSLQSEYCEKYIFHNSSRRHLMRFKNIKKIRYSNIVFYTHVELYLASEQNYQIPPYRSPFLPLRRGTLKHVVLLSLPSTAAPHKALDGKSTKD